jgi:NAD(P)-dependent dehydrogenase (short-subunit alcohol dehydrogenase family)
MLERRYGRIINISSLAGHTSFPYTEAYAAAKDGLTAFSRVLHSDYRDTGVTATSIILGPVKDAGVSARTLAETGLTASTAFSVSPQKVAAATLRAIGNPKAEIVVSIGPGRLLKALMDYFPGLGPALNRLSGAGKLMTSVADYREATRAYPAATTTPSPHSPPRPYPTGEAPCPAPAARSQPGSTPNIPFCTLSLNPGPPRNKRL